MKKVLSLLLVFVLAMSCMVTTALAEDAEEVMEVTEVVEEATEEAPTAEAEKEAASAEPAAEPAPAEQPYSNNSGAISTLIVGVILLAFGGIIIGVLPKVKKRPGSKKDQKK